MFENLPPWALQQAAQQNQQANPAPMIMSPFQPRQGGVGPYVPPQPQMPQDPSGMAGGSSTPIGMGAQMASLFGNPQAQATNSNNPMAAGQGVGPLLQLLAQMKNGRQGQGQLPAMSEDSQIPGSVTPQQQIMMDNQIPGGGQMPSSGGIMDWLKGLFGGGQ